MIKVYTDASVCPDNKIATYAFFIDGNKKQLKHGVFNEKTANSAYAEQLAIYQAFVYIVLHYPNEKQIIIHCDNASVVSNFNQHYRACSHKKGKQVYNIIMDVAKTQNIDLKIRPCKAHGNCSQNNIVDSYAHGRLKTERELKQLKYSNLELL